MNSADASDGVKLLLYRIVPERFVENLSGHGGSYRDGARWNDPGYPVLYFGTSAAVALLEMGHYLPSPRLVPKDYVLGTYEVETEAVESVALESLPDDWDAFPYPDCTRHIGTQFLAATTSLLLLVPSAAAAGVDRIAVVNPRHPEIEKLKPINIQSRLYNPRLFQGVR